MQRGSVKLLVVLLLVALVGAVSYLVIKSGKGGAVSSVSSLVGSGEAPDLDKLEDTLLSRVPEDALGFAYWQGNSAAYKKLQESPWAGSGSLAELRDASEDLSKLIDALAKSGLDIENEEEMKKISREMVLFALPPEASASGQDKLPFAWLVKSNGKDFSKVLSGALVELPKAGVEVKEFAVSGPDGNVGQGLEIIGQQGAEKIAGGEETRGEMFLLALDDLLIGGLDESVVKRTALYAGGKLPAIVKKDLYSRTLSGLPAEDLRFALVYVDFEAVEEKLSQVPVEGVNLKDNPLRSLALGASMLDAPHIDMRAINKNPLEDSEDIVSASNVLFSAAPVSPMLLLTLDGDLITKGVKKMAENVPGSDAQLSFLSGIKRFGVSLAVAPLGQSMLPVPDVMLMFESDDPETLKKGLEQAADEMITSSLGSQGGPGAMGMQWTEKELTGGKKMKGMMTPMGFGLFISSFDSLVVAASTEKQLQELAAEVDTKSLLSGEAIEVFREAQTVGNLYISFSNLASFLENISGMIGMFAPQQAGQAAAMLSPEKMAKLRKMGSLVAYATLKGDTTDVKLFYETPAK